LFGIQSVDAFDNALEAVVKERYHSLSKYPLLKISFFLCLWA
jgi:hypothetical protein